MMLPRAGHFHESGAPENTDFRFSGKNEDTKTAPMLTEEEFRLFRDLIYRESGIYMKETRRDFLENRLLKRMGAAAVSSPYRYYKLITETKKTEMLVLLDLLTVNETSFFRNRPQIELFGNVILPEILRKESRGTPRRLRIWSAGCSTGEEPYTIAMVVHEMISPSNSPFIKGGDEGGWDVRIFASDLSLTALKTASRGEYEKEKVRGLVDERCIERYFEEEKECYRIRDDIREMVVFDFHNLKNSNGLKDLNVIFCRNVMIYFDEEEQRRLVKKFHESLNPGGYLLLGHAESLRGLSADFEFIYDNKGTAYKKSEKENI